MQRSLRITCDYKSRRTISFSFVVFHKTGVIACIYCCNINNFQAAIIPYMYPIEKEIVKKLDNQQQNNKKMWMEMEVWHYTFFSLLPVTQSLFIPVLLNSRKEEELLNCPNRTNTTSNITQQFNGGKIQTTIQLMLNQYDWRNKTLSRKQMAPVGV